MIHFNRDEAMARLVSQSETFDIAIIGGGASGLGAAVDAAARGYRVVLIEQSDFAKGTSSRSTKLVHGGVRYLRQGNISLVLEALKERGLLYANAPHLVHNMTFVIPNYSWWEGPFYGIGMRVYDRMAGKLGLSPSRLLSREETVALIPTVEQKNLSGGVIYHDGQFDDARLAISLAQTAADLGAVVVNYVQAVGLVKENGIVAGIEAQDQESGRQFTLRAKCVINATGVFVDSIRRLDEVEARSMVAVSQGIHLVLPKAFLPGNAAIMIPKTADGRVLFAVPWHNHVVVGTTDTPVAEASLEPRALAEEIEFVMTHAAQYLSQDPTPSDVRSVFAGLRPLVKQGEGAHTTNTAALSRDHTIVVSESGLITITGGKWTTYRKMAQDVIDQAEIIADLDGQSCRTERLHIHGWTDQPIEPDHWRVYGSNATHLQLLMNEEPHFSQRLHSSLPYQCGEVVWHTRHEMARTVEDVLGRRTRMLLLHARAAIEAAPRVAALMARELGRDGAWEKQQVTAFNALAQGYLFPQESG
ncbi:MAG: glycerol-3-phosphate dehydrogenase/oxidase [Armatimonadota bacterium]|nr:glycerol-3-phosphate dehydrogenase/oxidase [Armatimonadota bacterium]